MKNCWPDGDLRAYIDGELTPGARQTIAAHLKACSTCGARYRELAERAAWVYATIELSEAPSPARPRRWRVGAAPSGGTVTGRAGTPARPRRWRVGAAGLAAALAMAFVLLPKHAPVRPAPALAKLAVPPAPVPTAPPVVHPAVQRPAPPEAKAAVPPAPMPPVTPLVQPVVQRRAPRHPKPAEEFVRLDDYPIETATVVRVSAEDGALQADLIVGPDGRAHAIRIVRNR